MVSPPSWPSEFAGVGLLNPLVVASGPLTRKASLIRDAHLAGAGAASLKLTFIKEPFPGQMRSFSVPDQVILSPLEKRLSIEEGATLCREAKEATDLPLWANISAGPAEMDDWYALCEQFIEAGTDGLELNFCCPNLETGGSKVHGGAAICTSPEASGSICRNIKKRFDHPVMVKIVPNTPLFTDVIQSIAGAGADGLHVVGAPVSGAPPVDPDTLRPVLPFAANAAFGSTNGSVCKYNTMRTIALARKAAPELPLMASGGIDTWQDCVSFYTYGADCLALCSTVMWHGWERLTRLTEDLALYLERTGRSVEDVRGKALEHIVPADEIEMLAPLVEVDTEKCMACGRCTVIGHCEALSTDSEGKAVIDTTVCIGCGICSSICPANAISYVHKEVR